MRPISFMALSRLSAIALLGVALAGGPVLAGNGNGGGNGNANGNGGGNGNKGGNSQSHGQGHGKSNSKAANSSVAPDAKKIKVVVASKYGKLNGFLHASPTALAKASPSSAIGKVAKVYAGLLNSYLAPAEGTMAPSIEDVAAALDAAANKPLTADVVKAVNDRLLATDTDLSANLTASGKTPQQLADEIAAAL